MTNHRWKILFCLFLVAVILAVYLPMRSHEFITFDDPAYITKNKRVRAGWTIEGFTWAFTTTHHRHWHPLTWLSHMTDVQLFGLDAGWHHLTSVWFHLANTLLLFLVLHRMTGALWRSGFVAALFALHPLHVETVAWVADRKDVLCTLFWLLAMWAYGRYAERPGFLRYGLVFFFFVFGLMSKAMILTLPFILLLMDFWPLNRFEPGKSNGEREPQDHPTQPAGYQTASAVRLVGEKVVLFISLGLGIVVTVVAVHKGGDIPVSNLWTETKYISTALVSYVRYIGKMLWPHAMALPYPHPRTPPLLQTLGAGVGLLAISILVLLGRRERPYLLTGWLWYLVTLLPVIGLLKGGPHYFADRYTYVPLVGLFIIIAWGLPDLLAGWRHRRVVTTIGGAIVISSLMILSWLQLRHWKNSESLYTHAIKVTDNNEVAHNNLGNVLKREGKLEEAEKHYAAALRINPKYRAARTGLKNTLQKQGKLVENSRPSSGGTYRSKPDPAETFTKMGTALMEKGRLERATRHYKEALRINPDYARAHNGLADVLTRQGKLKEAIEHYTEALRIDPEYAQAHSGLADVLKSQGKFEEAIEHYTEALRIDPEYSPARTGLKGTLPLMRKPTEVPLTVRGP